MYQINLLLQLCLPSIWSLHPLHNYLINQSYFLAGEFQCPVLNKVFTEFTHIVAVKTTGNVFCYEVISYSFQVSSLILWYFLILHVNALRTQAIQELNIKPKNWKELLTDEPFTRNDLITIQVTTMKNLLAQFLVNILLFKIIMLTFCKFGRTQTWLMARSLGNSTMSKRASNLRMKVKLCFSFRYLFSISVVPDYLTYSGNRVVLQSCSG